MTAKALPPTDSPIDAGIAGAVAILRAGGVETFESCEGGPGHAYPRPTVRFHGQPAAGFHALAVALDHGLPVSALHRLWTIDNGEPTGPYWVIVFSSPVPYTFHISEVLRFLLDDSEIRYCCPQCSSCCRGTQPHSPSETVPSLP